MARVVGAAVARLASRLPIFRRTAAQVAGHARAWERRNVAELARTGPLWVVLGDSSGQGVGVPDYDGGYVGQLLEVLGPRWRVYNLSRSGARTRDVIEEQLPRLATLPTAELVSAIVGANDATHTAVSGWLADVDALCAGLPAGALVATVPRGWREQKAAAANEGIRAAAAGHGLRLVDLWAGTGPPYQGKYADGFHPNARGYRDWTAAILRALEPPQPG